jgi:glycosyltransferase involved in cell wall biosynthesis
MSGHDFLLSMPVHNEAGIIETSLRRTLEVMGRLPASFEILVVDNASTDGTAHKVRALALPNVSVLMIPRKGKGAAIWEGGRLARDKNVNVFGFIDADLSADPGMLPELHEFLARDQADIVIGSRLLQKHRVKRSIARTLSSEIFNFARRIILGISVRDTQCGMKLLNARALQVLERCTEGTWFLDMELLARAQREGLRIKEVAVDWDEFRFPGRKSKLNIVRDGVAAIIAMFRIRISMLQS